MPRYRPGGLAEPARDLLAPRHPPVIRRAAATAQYHVSYTAICGECSAILDLRRSWQALGLASTSRLTPRLYECTTDFRIVIENAFLIMRWSAARNDGSHRNLEGAMLRITAIALSAAALALMAACSAS